MFDHMESLYQKTWYTHGVKKIWIAIVVIFTLSLAGGGIYLRQRSQFAAPSVESPVVVEPTPAPVELVTWDDPNGFQFQYPKDLTVDPHEEDNQNYAHIEFTNPTHPGSVIVWAKDTKAADAAAWIKGEKSYTGAVILDTTIGEREGKKVLTEISNKKIIAAVVDGGVVFYIEGDLKDSEYWTGVHDTISGSFAFTYDKAQATAASDGASEEYAVDEEEVIE